MTNQDLANIIFPDIDKTIEDYENIYPKRDRKEGAVVTRFAPSPTGFVHIGHLFSSYIAYKVAHDTDGIVFLRIEDTDTARTVENGISHIIRDLNNYNITFDEGMIDEANEVGDYGPYLQSKRKKIYHAFAKHLIVEGKAYPCFMSKKEVDEIREQQMKKKERIGIYGKYAKYRDLPLEEAIAKIKNKEPYVIRFKSPGDFHHKIEINDIIRGKLSFPENDLDKIIIKSDSLPDYAFAHVVDDHLMQTTHVIRSDEWISSLPIHVQLFRAFSFKVPKYAHLAPLMKIDENGGRRKLSKRKDPESAVSYYHEQGIPKEAVILYILVVANSNFEAWYESNKESSLDRFKFDFKKVSISGPLFDYEKLLNISKNYISRLSALEVYDKAYDYAKEYDLEFKDLLEKYKDYSIAIFNIEREQKKPRKDYVTFGTIKQEIWYMYDELFQHHVKYHFEKIKDKKEIHTILSTYLEKYYCENDDKETWFNKMKQLTEELGYASNIKDYRQNPTSYKGDITDITTVIRVAITTQSISPDLYEILRLLGKKRIQERFEKVYSNE